MAKTLSNKKKEKVANEAKNASPENKASFLPARFAVVLIFLFVLVAALCYKAFYLQVLDSERMIKEANNRSIRTNELPFTRGRILDRNGRIMSISTPMESIAIDPKVYFDTQIMRSKKRWRALALEVEGSAGKIQASVNDYIKLSTKERKHSIDLKSMLRPENDQYWQDLAKITGIEYNLLVEKVRSNPQSKFIELEREKARTEQEKFDALAKALNVKSREITDKLYNSANQRFLYLGRHETQTIAEYISKLDIDSITFKSEFRRFYPLAEEASQLVGFTDLEGQGEEGLERSFNSLLVGKNGKQVVRRDKKGNVIENIRDEQQYDPQDVTLSIDEELQSMVYLEIKKAVKDNKAESGTAVLVDVQTGEILAMANAPSFNPNNRSNLKQEMVRNRAITDTFEPGSTVKPLVVLTALQQKVTYHDEVINTRKFVVNGHTITDVAPRESLTLTGILQKSSNIGVSRLALRMSSTALVDTYTKVGFGKDTGLGLGEQKGTNGNRSRWADIERATLAYGYGLNVTPLQLARAYATLGSFGIYRPLSITKVDPPVLGERVLPEKITKDVVAMMETVAHKGEGGARAAVDGYRVAIKTGTARKLEKGKYVEKHIAYTAGVAPASDPRFALVVLINEPSAGNYYGGAVSAPLFSSIMKYTLRARNIKPDNITDDTSVVREINTHSTN